MATLTNNNRYSESIGILYSDNILNFRQTRTITDFKATILPQRFEEIRSLHLGCPLEAFWDVDIGTQLRALCASPVWYPGDVCFYWIPAWEAIKSMKGLKNLRVSLWQFARPHEPDSLPTIDKLVELFKSVVGVVVPNFHVEFYWPVNIEELQRSLNGKLSCSFEVKDETVSPK